MIRIKLPWKERKVVAEVAKLYCDMAIHGDGYEDRVRQFWRISIYAKIGLLLREDLKTICTAMEAFNEYYQQNPSFKDPNGVFKDMDKIIPKLRALL